MSASKKLIQASAGVGGGDFYPYTVDNSCRFDSGSSAEMSRTFAAGSTTTWTYSTWVKKVNNGSQTYLIATPAQGGYGITAFVSFTPSGAIDFVIGFAGGSTFYRLITNRLLRDFSSWTHIVAIADTTNGTAGDRMQLWVNGVRETSFSTAVYPPASYSGVFNRAYIHYINADSTGGSNGDYYLSQTCFIDGQALDPTSFGEDKNGVWIPKDVSGLTFGTNGFYLDFANSAALGTDVSGNNNNWTVSGLTSSDSMIDTPTNNFPTLNPLKITTGSLGAIALSNGNLVAKRGSGTAQWQQISATTMLPQTGKWYWRTTITAGTQGIFGVVKGYADIGMPTINQQLPGYNTELQNRGFGYSRGSRVIIDSTSGTSVSGSTLTSTPTVGDTITIGMDMDAGTMKVYVNTTLQTTFTPNTFDPTEGWVPTVAVYTTSDILTVDFGAEGGTFSALESLGYLPLPSTNLPEPTIGPNSAIKPEDCFAVRIVEGTGAELVIDDLDFQPDLVIGKNRDAADSWTWFDSVRGATVYMTSDLSQTPITDSQSLKSFDANGITLGTSPAVNTSGETYVWYFFKITPGFFDIQGYTGNGSVLNVSHNLGVEPDMMVGVGYGINPRNFVVYCSSLPVADPETDYLLMDTDAAVADLNTVWNDTAPTSTEFTLGSNVNLNSNTYAGVMYLFADVEGFCKAGYYEGNGNADGAFEYLGFSPDFRFGKRTDSTGSWLVQDTARSPNNIDSQPWLILDDTTAEGNAGGWDMLSNGIKLRTTNSQRNASGGDYITLSIGGNSIKYSNAR
jgi:hypothetical protein